MSIVIIICHIIILYIIYKYSLLKITRLNDSINLYATNKDINIARVIDENNTSKDEISSLAKSFSSLIYEIHNYTNYIQEIFSELYKTKNALDAEHERSIILEELSKKDALTGVKNKTAYDYSIKNLEKQIDEGNAKFAIAIIDLNSLKHINDTYGHECGNFLIKKLCTLLCTIFSHSTVYRICGDEFIIILENSGFDNINLLLTQFIDEMHKMSVDKKLKPWERVSAAIGIAYYDQSIGNDNIESIFKRADDEMYTMKKRMKNAA